MSDPLEFARYSIDDALTRIRALMVAAKNNPRAHDFYFTIEQCMIAIDYASAASQNMHHMFGKLLSRVELMEYSLARHVKDEQKHPRIQAACGDGKPHTNGVPNGEGVSLPESNP